MHPDLNNMVIHSDTTKLKNARMEERIHGLAYDDDIDHKSPRTDHSKNHNDQYIKNGV
jgi:hypothetical protein